MRSEILLSCSVMCIGLAVFCGCEGSTPSLPGTWDDTTDGNESVTFSEDGTWTWTDELRGSTGLPATSSGTWNRIGDVVTVSGTNLDGQVFNATCEFLSNGNLYCPRFVETTDEPHPEEFEKQ